MIISSRHKGGGRGQPLRDDSDFSPQTGGAGDSLIEGPEWDVKELGEGHVDTVIDGQVGPQLPGSAQQQLMGVPLQRQVGQILGGLIGAEIGELGSGAETSQHLQDLDIDQVGTPLQSRGWKVYN